MGAPLRSAQPVRRRRNRSARASPRHFQGAYDGEIAATDAQVGRLLAALEATRATRLHARCRASATTASRWATTASSSTASSSTMRRSIFRCIIAGPGVPVRAGGRAGADRGRDADRAGPRSACRRRRRSRAQSLLPLGRGERARSAGVQRDLLPAVSLRLERAHRGARRPLQVHRRAAARAVRHRGRSRRDAGLRRGESAHGRRAGARRCTRCSGAPRAGAATQTPQPMDPDAEQRLRALGYVGGRSAARDRRQAARRPEGHDPSLQPAQACRAGFGRWPARCRHRESPGGARRRTRTSSRRYTMLGNMHTKAAGHATRLRHISARWPSIPSTRAPPGAWRSPIKRVGQGREARAGFERVLQLDPRGAKPLCQLADICDAPAATSRAQRHLLEKGLTLDADRAAFLVKLGEARIELQAARRGRGGTDRGDRDSSRISRWRITISRLVYEARGNAAGGATEYEAEIKAQPEAVPAAFQPGQAARRQRARRPKRSPISAPRWKRPDFGTGYLYLAKALLDAGDLAAAEQAARRGLALTPDPAGCAARPLRARRRLLAAWDARPKRRVRSAGRRGRRTRRGAAERQVGTKR